MGLSVISPVQMQTPEEEVCSKKQKQYTETETEKDLIHVCEADCVDSDFDEEEDTLRNDKILDELMKIHKKNIEAIASCKKPNCETNIDRPVATDMGPGDEPKKIRGKKKKKKKNENERV